MLFKIASRNIFRNKRRTFLTVSMMVFGYVLFSFFLSLGDGAYGNIINQFINARTGEYQLHAGDYLDEPKLYKAISNPRKVQAQIQENPAVLGSTLRIRGGALAFYKNKTLGVQVIGYDVKGELENTTFASRVKEGNIPTSNDTYSLIIGKKIAKVLKIGIGEEIALISAGSDGSMANDLFKISGIIGGEEAGLDDQTIYMPLATAQEFFSLWGRVHEIMIRTKQRDISGFKFEGSEFEGLTLSSWKVVEKDFYKAMEADKTGDNIGRFIIILVVALGVFNTILMSILERKREFGVLKAIGTKPWYLTQIILLETLFMSFIGVGIGMIIAFGVNWYFSVWGIQLAEPFEYGGFVFAEMKGVLNFEVFLFPLLVIVFTSVLVCLFPAIKAGRQTPMEALRG